ncbi:MAG: hypothetical protein LAN84_08450 [Acidobacteriia bacterium]|nr:hypothetical protein [Terriglobia bacterium]
MANQPAPQVTPISGSAPSPVLDDLQNVIAAQRTLEEERKKLKSEFDKTREQWTFDLAKEVAKSFNLPSLVNRAKDLDKKKQTFDEQHNSLSTAIKQLADTIESYEKDQAKRNQLIQALDVQMQQVGVACHAYEGLEKWRNRLVGMMKKPGRKTAK